MDAPQHGLVIAGGGLAGGLMALALAERRPDLDILLVEGGTRIGGNHLWSFFDSDIAPDHRWLVEPLIGKRWEGRYDVRFPAHSRTLPGTYNTIFSETLDARVRQRVGKRVWTGMPIAAVDPGGVTLADQTRIHARAVIDARGAADLSLLDTGWQKFVGHELVLDAPHGVTRPVIMDATVPQLGGYRFVYLLPFAPDRIFVEDTYYADTPEVDVPALEARIAAYAEARGWRVTEIARREVGSLPVAIGGDFEGYWRSGGDGIGKAGVRAGLFHPTTGYSLPDAVRTAMLVADAPEVTTAAIERVLHDNARDRWRERGFYRMLDTMLFRAAGPEERYRVLERFYRLDEGLVARFYASQSTGFDRLRVLVGKPPIPIGRALKAILGGRR